MMALQVAKDRLPTYAHMYSPRKFTQPQLFACLVLKRHFKHDYRGIVAMLADMPALCEDMGLKSVPHYTTLQKAAYRLLNLQVASDLLESTHEQLRSKKNDTSEREAGRSRQHGTRGLAL